MYSRYSLRPNYNNLEWWKKRAAVKITTREMKYRSVLYCTALYCTVLYCTALYCTVLHCTVLYCRYGGLTNRISRQMKSMF